MAMNVAVADGTGWTALAAALERNCPAGVASWLLAASRSGGPQSPGWPRASTAATPRSGVWPDVLVREAQLPVPTEPGIALGWWQMSATAQDAQSALVKSPYLPRILPPLSAKLSVRRWLPRAAAGRRQR